MRGIEKIKREVWSIVRDISRGGKKRRKTKNYMYKKIHGQNKLSMIVSPMDQMTSISLGVWIGVGGRYETPEKSGISHFVEHMLFKGTATRTAKNLKEAIEGVGGVFNGFTSDEITCYMVKVPAKYMELGMDILSDMVLNAKFDVDDIKRERFVICEEIKMYRDQPSDYVMDLLNGIMWPNNPLGRPLTGTIATVKSVTRDDIIKFRDDNYHPANIAVVAAGKVDPDHFFSYASDLFKGEEKKLYNFKKSTISQKAPKLTINNRDIQQMHIAMGFHAIDTDIKERFAFKLMNVILGGNMSSRLFEELREKHGLCYDISSLYKKHSDVGEVQIHAGVDSRKSAKAVLAILDEVRKLRDLGTTDDELVRAKEYAKGQFLLAMEGTSTRMIWLGDRYMVHKDIPEVNDVLKRIDAVTCDNVQKVCEKIFNSSSVNLAMVGKIGNQDKKKINKALAGL